MLDICSDPEYDGQFVREFYYGVCDNFMYSYDAVNDSWRRITVKAVKLWYDFGAGKTKIVERSLYYGTN